jgi:hypothetical protein
LNTVFNYTHIGNFKHKNKTSQYSENIPKPFILASRSSRKLLLLEREDGLDSSGSAQGPVKGSCEHGNEPSNSIKY